MTRPHRFLLAAAALLYAALAPALSAAALSKTDAAYLAAAMQRQLGRYAIATLGEKRAAVPALRTLAHRMAVESSAQTRVLDAIARSSGIALPKKPTLRDTYHYAQLAGLHGAAFDRAFVREVRIDDAITIYADRNEERHGSDPRLRAFARRRLTALEAEEHALERIR